MTFVERLVAQLNGIKPGAAHSFQAKLLARELQRRIERFEDGFDIGLTGDEEQDQEAVAAWLEAREHDPPYCAPMWGRNFSGWLAWLLRKAPAGTPLDLSDEMLRTEDR
jgi:hypothetical protein